MQLSSVITVFTPAQTHQSTAENEAECGNTLNAAERLCTRDFSMNSSINCCEISLPVIFTLHTDTRSFCNHGNSMCVTVHELDFL